MYTSETFEIYIKYLLAQTIPITFSHLFLQFINKILLSYSASKIMQLLTISDWADVTYYRVVG